MISPTLSTANTPLDCRKVQPKQLSPHFFPSDANETSLSSCPSNDEKTDRSDSYSSFSLVYPYKGGFCTFDIKATSASDAQERLHAIKGGLMFLHLGDAATVTV